MIEPQISVASFIALLVGGLLITGFVRRKDGGERYLWWSLYVSLLGSGSS